MMKAPVISPSSTSSASVKSVRIRIMNASSIVVWFAASFSANVSAARSRAVGSVSPLSFGSSSWYSPGALSEGSRAVAQRAHSLSAAIRSRTSSFSAKGSRPPYFVGR
jgi:hypothetical protein